jgi:hypothetical protein
MACTRARHRMAETRRLRDLRGSVSGASRARSAKPDASIYDQKDYCAGGISTARECGNVILLASSLILR